MDLSENNGIEKRNRDQFVTQLLPQSSVMSADWRFGAPIGIPPANSPFPVWQSDPIADSFNVNNLLNPNKSPFSSILPQTNFPTEPGFIERAARFSCFSNNPISSPLSSNPPQKSELNSLPANSGSKECPNGEDGTNPNGEDDANVMEDSSPNDQIAKKRKRTNQEILLEEQNSKQNSESKKEGEKSDTKKGDYIHVRARRGQATNSHSLAERVRRERISERMKYLQELVPGCSKVTGKAVMLDEIINYVQSLQRQVEFLSMKLAAVNPRLDLNIETLLSKDILNSNLGCSSSFGFSLNAIQIHPQLHLSQQGLLPSGISNLLNSNAFIRRGINTQLTSINGYNKEPNLQMNSNPWQEELHNVMNVNFATNPPLNTQEGPAGKPGDGF